MISFRVNGLYEKRDFKGFDYFTKLKDEVTYHYSSRGQAYKVYGLVRGDSCLVTKITTRDDLISHDSVSIKSKDCIDRLIDLVERLAKQ